MRSSVRSRPTTAPSLARADSKSSRRRSKCCPGPDRMRLDDIRRLAVAQSLFRPTTLRRAMSELGYVQADPIRAPARAQDLILRHRVKGYRAGMLEQSYAKLAVEEDFFLN